MNMDRVESTLADIMWFRMGVCHCVSASAPATKHTLAKGYNEAAKDEPTDK